MLCCVKERALCRVVGNGGLLPSSNLPAFLFCGLLTTPVLQADTSDIQEENFSCRSHLGILGKHAWVCLSLK